MPKGIFKHKPTQGFQKGHKINLGKTLSIETKKKISQSRIAEKNPNWVGDNIEYNPLHTWVRKRLKLSKPDNCPNCGKKTKVLDIANKGIYNRNLENWEYLCRRCHMIKDGRLDALIKRNKTK